MVGNNPIGRVDPYGLDFAAMFPSLPVCMVGPCPGNTQRQYDDAGKSCCPQEMQPVYLHTDTSFRKRHSFIETPNRAVGFYPGSYVLNGKMQDDSGTTYHDSRSFKACPESIKALEESINSHQSGIFTPWNFPGNNCTSWACGRLADGGFNPPGYRWTPFQNPWVTH